MINANDSEGYETVLPKLSQQYRAFAYLSDEIKLQESRPDYLKMKDYFYRLFVLAAESIIEKNLPSAQKVKSYDEINEQEQYLFFDIANDGIMIIVNSKGNVSNARLCSFDAEDGINIVKEIKVPIDNFISAANGGLVFKVSERFNTLNG